MNKNRFLIVLIILIASCTQPIMIEGFDNQSWIADTDGCNGKRKTLATVLESNKQKLLGKDQAEITAFLGKPDQHEIYRRSQRFYIYMIDPGSSCTDYLENKTPASFTIRFNAMGKAHEIVHYK